METDPDVAALQRATERAEQALGAWTLHLEEGHDLYSTLTPRGQVELIRVEECLEANGLICLDVWVGGETESGDPHFRVVNPPLLVEDPAGGQEVRGRSFREDPLAALAQAIGEHGGAQLPRRRRRYGR